MALEKRDATRLVSFEPPLPRRGFPITAVGSTTDADDWGGGGEDGRQYGRFTIDASQWAGVNGSGIPPMSPGERFQVYSWNGAGHGFLPNDGQIPQYSPDGAPDLYRIEYMLGQDTGTVTSPSPPWVLKTPDLRTVLGVKQRAVNSWDVFFTPYLDDDVDIVGDGIVTFPEPRNGIWLGTLGHEMDLKYSWSCPGGPTSLSFTLTLPPDSRSVALDPGRVIQGFRGASCVWEGILAEPQPTATGWGLTVDGAGTYGQNFAALFETSLDDKGVIQYVGWNADQPVNRAIGRGMRWQDDGIGKPTGIYLDNPQEPGTMTIQDFLNQLTSGGSLYWSVEPPGNAGIPARPWVIRLRPFPSDLDGNPLAAGSTTPEKWEVSEWQRIDLKAVMRRRPPDLYLVNVSPVPRTITNDYNTLIIKYQVSADVTASGADDNPRPAVTTVTVVDNPISAAAHTRREYYLDLTSSGTKTQAQVIAVGQNILKHYVRANFSQSYTVQPGQLLNNGGAPVDLGCNYAGKTATVVVENSPLGGEVHYGPLTFLIGEYEFDDPTGSATVTPFQSQKSDLASVISQLYPGQFN